MIFAVLCVSSCCVMMCCTVMCYAVDRVQCGGRVVKCMIELGVLDGWFV